MLSIFIEDRVLVELLRLKWILKLILPILMIITLNFREILWICLLLTNCIHLRHLLNWISLKWEGIRIYGHLLQIICLGRVLETNVIWDGISILIWDWIISIILLLLHWIILVLMTILRRGLLLLNHIFSLILRILINLILRISWR